MKILIPSRSRAGDIKTAYAFPPSLRDNIIVYVAKEQLEEYKEWHPDLNIKSVSTMDDLLGQKLYLMAKDKEDEERVIMCDDDFAFFTRIDPDKPQLRPLEPLEFSEMLIAIDDAFDSNSNLYGVGVSMRQGNNRLDPDFNPNTRLNGFIAYNTKRFLSVEHDRTNPMNDFDVNLQLLRKGYDNELLSQYCYNQGGTNAPGGSSDYRTLETQAQAAHKLAEMHPGFVSIRKKVNKTGDPSLRERTEVTVYWKKARASANG